MIALFGIVALLALNAFFVAAEFALVKVRVTQIEPIARRGDRRAVAARDVLDRLDRYLSVTQFGITVASLGLGWIGEPALTAIADRATIALTGHPLEGRWHVAVDVVALAALTYAHLLLGELVPKFIAIQRSEAVVLFSALPLRFVSFTFSPLLWVLEKSQRACLRFIGLSPDAASDGKLSEEEIIGMLAANAAHSPHARGKEDIIERTMRFARRPVRQSMVPRVDVFSLPIDTPGERAYELILEQQYSRIPLTRRESLDEIVGYLYAKDLFLAQNGRSHANLASLRRDALVVPQVASGLDTLREMQQKGIPFGIVVDEYGGTSGIVTMEDLVEEVVGDIRDELDVEPPKIAPAPGDPHAWDVDGAATMEELRGIGVTVDDAALGETVGAQVVKNLGRMPKVGDTVRLGDTSRAEVRGVHRRRVQRVRVHTADEGAPPAVLAGAHGTAG